MHRRTHTLGENRTSFKQAVNLDARKSLVLFLEPFDTHSNNNISNISHAAQQTRKARQIPQYLWFMPVESVLIVAVSSLFVVKPTQFDRAQPFCGYFVL